MSTLLPYDYRPVSDNAVSNGLIVARPGF